MTKGLIHQPEDCYRTVAHIEYPDDSYGQEIHDWLASGGIVGMVIRKRYIGQPFSRAQAFKFANDWINDANRKSGFSNFCNTARASSSTLNGLPQRRPAD